MKTIRPIFAAAALLYAGTAHAQMFTSQPPRPPVDIPNYRPGQIQRSDLGPVDLNAPRVIVAPTPPVQTAPALPPVKNAKKECTVENHYCVPVPEDMPFDMTATPKAKPGDIIINTAERKLYLLLENGLARRYIIAVGKDGSAMPNGKYNISSKQPDPDWIPLPSMHEEFARRGKRLAARVPGGTPQNPLGVRAIYIDKKNEHFRIHGTNEPLSIGKSVSHGCFRMENEDVTDLYDRLPATPTQPEGFGKRVKVAVTLHVVGGPDEQLYANDPYYQPRYQPQPTNFFQNIFGGSRF